MAAQEGARTAGLGADAGDSTDRVGIDDLRSTVGVHTHDYEIQQPNRRGFAEFDDGREDGVERVEAGERDHDVLDEIHVDRG
jgi:hypothetical protein